MTQRGFPGEPGHPGQPGEEGKDSGEGGRGGEGGEGGVGGAGAPQGPGGGGGEGGVGGRGARGAQGPRGAPGPVGADGTQPKLRWAPAVGYALLAIVLGSLMVWTYNLAQDNRRLIAKVAGLTQAQAEKGYTDCVARNTRAAEATKSFEKLIAAHTRDGNPNTARVWQEYLDATRRVPLPPCVKPPPEN